MERQLALGRFVGCMEPEIEINCRSLIQLLKCIYCDQSIGMFCYQHRGWSRNESCEVLTITLGPILIVSARNSCIRSCVEWRFGEWVRAVHGRYGPAKNALFPQKPYRPLPRHQAGVNGPIWRIGRALLEGVTGRNGLIFVNCWVQDYLDFNPLVARISHPE